MACYDDAPTRNPMRRDRLFEAFLIVLVECAHRLIEEPDRSTRDGQSGERQPSSLAGGQPAAGPIGYRSQRERVERRIDQLRRARIDRPQGRPKAQGFARGQAWFDTVLVTHV